MKYTNAEFICNSDTYRKQEMAAEVNNCCGVSLKHGTIIIGVVQSILAFIALVLNAAYAEHPHELVDLSSPSILPDLSVLRVVLIIIATCSAIHCVFSILLIFGAETNRPLLLLPWLVFNPIGLFVYIIATLTAIIHHTGNNNTSFIVGHLFMSFIVSLLDAYQILTVYSFFKHLRKLHF